jgi:uncharacterized protein YciW
MTAKHFEAIAYTIKNAQLSGAARKRLANDMATTCAEQHRGGHYRFDRDRFLKACGVTA